MLVSHHEQRTVSFLIIVLFMAVADKCRSQEEMRPYEPIEAEEEAEVDGWYVDGAISTPWWISGYHVVVLERGKIV